MKWDVKLFVVSLLVYIIFIVLNYFDAQAIVAPMFLNTFYLPVFAFAMALSRPFTYGSVVCIFLALGHLAWPFEVYAINFSYYLYYGSLIGGALAVVGFAATILSKAHYTLFTRLLFIVLALGLVMQIVNVFFIKNEQVVQFADLAMLIAGYLLIAPKITSKIPLGRQRIILVLLLSISYNYLMNLVI